jgi:hypothetical protein
LDFSVAIDPSAARHERVVSPVFGFFCLLTMPAHYFPLILAANAVCAETINANAAMREIPILL